jgi:hypothetical protein
MARCGAMAELREKAARRQAASRLLTPSGLALALICFLFGFLAVSCDTPGGYGRSKQGGTTTYTGLDLATGARPTVDPAFLQPEPTTRPDLLGWQPTVALAAVALAVAMIAGAGRFRLRRRVVVASTAAALVLLVLGEVAPAAGREGTRGLRRRRQWVHDGRHDHDGRARVLRHRLPQTPPSCWASATMIPSGPRT